ncbi:MAG: HXXEE domain-containing protein [Terracidiphilus sp.]
MALDQLCWIATAALGAHVAEEGVLDWPGWVRAVGKVEVDWKSFYLVNAAGILWGIVCAEVASAMPLVALSLPALLLINATFFHVPGFILGRGRFSPGLISAVVLFYPIGILGYKCAYDTGVLTRTNLIGSLLLGAAVMLAPVLLFQARTLPYFRQDK